MRRTCDRRSDYTVLFIGFDNDTVLAELFLNEDDLLRSANDEITAWIQGALVHDFHFSIIGPIKVAFVTSQHDGHAGDLDIAPDDLLSFSGVCDVNQNAGRVSRISQAAFLGGDL